jgi:hypothetical protein
MFVATIAYTCKAPIMETSSSLPHTLPLSLCFIYSSPLSDPTCTSPPFFLEYYLHDLHY